MDVNLKISSQYLTEKKIVVTILDTIDPAHYIVKETADLQNASSLAKSFLEVEDAMQKYYASIQPGFFQLPLKDAIIVVLNNKKFYRAQVIRILTMTSGHLFKVFLLDYGIECSIQRDCIYAIEKDFLVHPFQAVSVKLLGLEPISMVMDPVNLTMSYGPVSDWDPSAGIHVHDLQKGMCSAYIEVQGTDNYHIYGRLYICYENNPAKCINDELVSNTFARFNDDCWKNVQKLESILGKSTRFENSASDDSISKKKNPEQLPTTPDPSIFESNFKMMFICPADGKIVAESSITKDTAESAINTENDLQLVEPSGSQEKSESTDSQSKNLKLPSNVESNTSKSKALEESKPSALEEQQAQLIAQKKFLKLQELNRKKYSSIQSTTVDIARVKSLQIEAKNKTEIKHSSVENCTEKTEISKTENISRDDEKNFSDSNLMVAGKPNISNCDNSKSSETILQSKSSNDRVEVASSDNSRAENMTQAELIAQKRFLKLQQLTKKRKSSIHSSNMDSPPRTSLCTVAVNTAEKDISSGFCSDKIENSQIGEQTKLKNSQICDKSCSTLCKSSISSDFDNSNLNDPNSQSNASNGQSSPESKLKQENTSEVILENLKTLQKLKNRVRLKKMKESLETSKKPSDGVKQIEEVLKDECSTDSSSNKICSSPDQLKNPSPSTKSPEESTDVDQTFVTQESIKSPHLKSVKVLYSKFRNSLQNSSEKNQKSPLSESSRDTGLSSDCETSSASISAGPKIINQLLNTSDYDDLLCAIPQKNDENVADKVNVEENLIKLSTELCPNRKVMTFNVKNLWEKQKLPILQIGVGIPPPVMNIEEAKFSRHLLQILKEVRFLDLSCIQSVVLPAIERNRSIIAIAPPNSGKTISYVLPLVSYLTRKEGCLSKGEGPYAIILCSSWVKAQAVVDFFHLFLRDTKVKIVTLCTDYGNCGNKVLSLVSGCRILIGTPFCLLQFLKKNCVTLPQLKLFIIDDGTAVMHKNKKELKSIILCLMNFAKKTQNFPQVLLCAERWDKNFKVIQEKVMMNPLLYFTSFLESAIYAKIPLFVHVSKSTNKKSALLDVLKEEEGKVVVCTTNVQDAIEVHHFLRCEDIRSFLVNEKMEHSIADEVIKDWKSAKCRTSSHCLVVTDPIVMKTCISNAECLVHYDIPSESRLQFGNRFSCIAEHFQKMDSSPKCVCHILITESECSYAPQIVEIVKNSGGIPSEELLDLCKMPKQDSNTSNQLCHYIKAFGFCKKSHCKYRHCIDAEIDKPQVVPSEGDIQALVTHVIDASHYIVKLLRYLDPVSNKTISLVKTYAEIGSTLWKFYKSAVEEYVENTPVVGKCYVLEEEEKLFYRVKILEYLPASESEIPKWKILFLDEGWIKFYSQLKLYKLTDQINLPEPLAVDVYACNISTLDSCYVWNPQTTRLVKDFIGGKEINGKIALCLGNTLWLDPIVLRLQLCSPKEYVNLFRLDQKLYKCGHVKINKNHLASLKQACEGKIALPHMTKHVIKKEDPKPEPSVNFAFLDCDTCEEVYVSSVVSPHLLYVQMEKFVDCLDDLLDKINLKVEKRMLKKPNTLYKGLHCIAPFHEDNRYYRAVITDVVLHTDVQLFYVDFGDSGLASKNNIYSVPEEFLLLPFQAIECELAGITAAHGGWTDSAARFLEELTRDDAGDMKILQLKAYSKRKCYEGGNHYVIDLWYNEKNISEQLLQAGYGSPADIPIVSSNKTPYFDDSPDYSDCEVFDLNQKYSTSTDEEVHPDDKDSSSFFYGVLAKMVAEEYNLISKPGKVSSDEEELLKELKKTSLPVYKEMPDNLKKLLPKVDQTCNNVASAITFSNSLKPLITWWDTPEELNILINLKDVKMYQLDITNEGLNFNTFISGNHYSVEETFYAGVQSNDARQYQNAQGINIHARKCTPFKWPRLTKEKRKFLHIKYDLIHIDDSDTEEKPQVDNKLKPPPPQYTIEESSSSTDEEEKYVEPWKDFAQNTNPYNLD